MSNHLIKKIVLALGALGILATGQVMPVEAGTGGAPQPPMAFAHGQGFTVMYAGTQHPWRNDISSTWTASGWLDSSVTPFPGTSYTIPTFNSFASNIGVTRLADQEWLQSATFGNVFCHGSGWQNETGSLIGNTALAAATPGSAQGLDAIARSRLVTLLVDTNGNLATLDWIDSNSCPSIAPQYGFWSGSTTAYNATATQVSKGIPGTMQAFKTISGGSIQWASHDFGSSTWGGWTTVPNGVATSNPSVTSLFDANGNLTYENVFVRGTTNYLYQNYRTSSSGGWVGWSTFGGTLFSGPGCASDGSSKMACFVVGSNSHIYFIHYDLPGPWSSWIDLGSPPTN